MDWLFTHFFERPPGTMFSNGPHVRAAVEIADTDDSIMVQVQVPGVSKDNLLKECVSIKTMYVQ
jgi:HSP20 family molecular chaperone IbpA